jgi:hypothetical protein
LFLLEDKFTVSVSDSLRPNITGDAALCNGMATLNADAGYQTYLWNTGETTPSITVTATGNYWVQVASGTCHGTGYASVAPAPEIVIQAPNQSAICIDEPMLSIPFTPISGIAGSFSLTFAEAGFTNILNQPITGNTIDIALPADVTPGIYHGTLTVYEQNCGKNASYQLEIMVKYPKEIITQRWNDVLSIINKETQKRLLYSGAGDTREGETFKGYQWYRNGQPISSSANGSYYYYEGSTFNQHSGDVYSALLTRENGDKVFTCDFVPDLTIQNEGNLLMPSPIHPMQILNSPENGTVTIWNITGTVYSVQRIENNQFTAPGAQGIYILQINNGRHYKILVN